MMSLKKGEKYWAILLLVVVMAVGAMLRFYRAGDQSLWTDEISSAVIAGSEVSDILSRNLSPDKADIPVEEPPMPYILMHWSMKLGETELTVRLPAIVFGILSIFALFLAAKELFGRRTAVAAAFLMSISLYHIIYSQEARGYSPHIFFSLLSLYFLWKACRSGGARNWGGFAVSTALNMYSHYSSFQVLTIEALIAAMFVVSGLWKRNRSTGELKAIVIGFAASVAAAGLLAAPLLKNFMGVVGSRLGGETIPFELNPVYFANLLARYGAGSGASFFIYNFFFAAGLWRAARAGRRLELAAAALWMLFPFLVLAHTGYKYFFHIRYVIFTFPVYLVFVANGVVWLYEALFERQGVAREAGRILPGAIFTVFAAVLFAALSLKPIKLYYSVPARLSDWKGVASHIKANWSPGTIILTESAFVVRELSYYLRDGDPRIEVLSVRGDAEKFKEVVTRNPSVWYVDGNPVFDDMVGALFRDRVTFGGPAYSELGRRWLIDWDSSWFSPSNIRRYYPVLYYNNIHANEGRLRKKGPEITRVKDSVFLSGPSLKVGSASCVNCEFESPGEAGAWRILFDGFEDDERFEVSLPVPGPVDLKRHRIVEVIYKQDGQPSLSLEAAASVDFDEDGITDAEVFMSAEPGINIFDAEEGFISFHDDLFELTKALYPGRAGYHVLGLKLILTNKRGAGISPEARMPSFELKSIEFFRRALVPAKLAVPEEGLYRIKAVSTLPVAMSKVKGLHVKDILKENAGIHCQGCSYETAGRSVFAHLGGGLQEVERLEITVPVKRPVDLSRFPVFEVTYRVEDDAIQYVGFSAELDWTFDGRPDGELEITGVRGINVFDFSNGYRLLQIGIPDEARKRFPAERGFALTGLKIIAGKRTGGAGRFYGFEFYDIELYGKWMRSEARKTVFHPPGDGWTSSGEGVKHAVAGEGASTVVAGFFERGSCKGAVIWLSRPMEASLDRYGYFSMPVELADPARQSALFFFDIDRDGDGRPDLTLKRRFTSGGDAYVDFREELRAKGGSSLGTLKRVRAGLSYEKKCRRGAVKDIGKGAQAVNHPEYENLHWRLGPARFEGGHGEPAPPRVLIDDSLHRMATRVYEQGTGVLKHESALIRLQKGVHTVSLYDSGSEARVQWIELERADGGDSYVIEVSDGGL